jgi:hypothetical protein
VAAAAMIMVIIGCRLQKSVSYCDALPCGFARLHWVWREDFCILDDESQNGTVVHDSQHA